jgi:hypothetical protein
MKPLTPLEGFTFGADPELFVKNDKGEIVCADMIPGTKDEPHKVSTEPFSGMGSLLSTTLTRALRSKSGTETTRQFKGSYKDACRRALLLVALPASLLQGSV